MRYCKRCVYPEIGVNLIFDDEGICSACRVAEEFTKFTPEYWAERKRRFEELIGEYRSKDQSNYDCIVTVSGGKDSYFQTYLIKEVYGLKPLLVTYHGNNYLPEGQENLNHMREVFGVDHLVFGPSVKTLVKLNRLCFKKMGDMNWHAHCGIKTYPLQVSVKYNIPLIIWGNITWNIAGMFSPMDFVEYNKRTVQEHDMRGYTWRDMADKEEGIEPGDLLWARFPKDQDIARVGCRGVYIENFFRWDANAHTKLMREKYRFEIAREPFARTYRMMSNLDDMHENGIHDYLKYVKFGYGRCSDHASEDIRLGYITREQGVELVRKLDHVKPRKDLERWLKYVDMTEEEFDRIADTFRDPRVWRKENGRWVKDNLWDEEGER
jgi:N-acetyl sugar amidotransferase